MSSSFKLKSDMMKAKSRTVEITAKVKAKSVKKVYNLPGQKQDPPEEAANITTLCQSCSSQRDPSRIFYESLSKQIPSSEMAEFWLMEHGLLPADKAKKALDRKQRKQQELRTGTPVKSQKLDRPESSRPQPPKSGDSKTSRRMSCDSDDEFIIKRIKSRV